MADDTKSEGPRTQAIRKVLEEAAAGEAVRGFVTRNRDALAILCAVAATVFGGWLSYRDILIRAAKAATVVLPDAERPGESLVERVTYIERTRWTPEDEARRDTDRTARERARDEAILAKLRELDGQSKAQAAQLAEVREWVRELVGETRRGSAGGGR